MIARLLDWTDERLGSSHFIHKALRKAFPDHWSFMLGEINFYCFLVLIATGTFLALWYVPSTNEIVYNGPYALLRGVKMSEAFESVMRISFQVNAGLLIRQIHHWAANVFLAAIVVHMCRIFFTGSFRKPRDINWVVGVLLFFTAMFEGFSGYSIPDDLLSGMGLRIAVSILQSVPFVGTYAMFWLLGGAFPSTLMLQRLFTLHVYIMPILLLGGISVHMMILWRQKHAQFPGPRHTERNVVGSPLFPNYIVKTLALLFGVLGVLTMLGAFVQINPVWIWGPYRSDLAITPAQPDWYVGWLEGALRIGPHWAIHMFGHMVPSVFWPGLVLPFIIMVVLVSYPFVEAFVTGDRAEHNLLDRPREKPARTALGVAFFVFMAGLFLAGADDLEARYTNLPLEGLVWFYRLFCIFGPMLAFAVTYALAGGLKARGGVHEAPRVRLTRKAEGGFSEDEIP